MSLTICRELARTNKLSAEALNTHIATPSDMGLFLNLYWSEGICPISNQVKRGLAKAFQKFSAQEMSTYTSSILLRTIMFLCHPKPQTAEQAVFFKSISDTSFLTYLPTVEGVESCAMR